MPATTNPSGSIPWEAIKLAYVTGSIGLGRLAKQFSISRSMITLKSATEGWVAERDIYRSSVGITAIAYAKDKQAEVLADKLELVDQVADLMLEQLLKLMSDPDQLRRHLIQREESTISAEGNFCKSKFAEDFIAEAVNSKSASELSAAVKNLQYVKRLTKGMMAPNDYEKLKIEREKLVMDQKRIGLSDEDEGNTGVILMPAADQDPGVDALPDPAGDIAL